MTRGHQLGFLPKSRFCSIVSCNSARFGAKQSLSCFMQLQLFVYVYSRTFMSFLCSECAIK